MSPSWSCRLTDTDDLCGLQNFISPMIMSAPTLPLSTSPDDFPPPAYQSPQKWVHSTLLEHIHIAACAVCMAVGMHRCLCAMTISVHV